MEINKPDLVLLAVTTITNLSSNEAVLSYGKMGYLNKRKSPGLMVVVDFEIREGSSWYGVSSSTKYYTLDKENNKKTLYNQIYV